MILILNLLQLLMGMKSMKPSPDKAWLPGEHSQIMITDSPSSYSYVFKEDAIRGHILWYYTNFSILHLADSVWSNTINTCPLFAEILGEYETKKIDGRGLF